MFTQIWLGNSPAMGMIRTVALTVLGISFFVFIALFGRLPIFRKTPIGFLHRLIMVYLPHGFVRLDQRLTGGRFSSSGRRLFDYLMNEPHPLVLIFFVLLQLISEILFIPRILQHIPLYPHAITIPIAVALPYTMLYLSHTVTSKITTKTHGAAMQAYPFDYVLYHPNMTCKTCQWTKPARSKHCSICKACTQRQDHHCIWINNCVGRNNYIHFILLLVSISMLLMYATTLGFGVLNTKLQERYNPIAHADFSMIASTTTTPQTQLPKTRMKWSHRLSWWEYIDAWSLMLSLHPRIGGVTLLAALTFPLSTAFLVYHTYIIYAGVTTNESSKWSDLKEDVDDDLVWKAMLEDMRDEYPGVGVGVGRVDFESDSVDPGRRNWKWWKTTTTTTTSTYTTGTNNPSGQSPGRNRVGATWWVIRTRNGMQPMRRKWAGREDDDDQRELDFRWRKVRSMHDVDNIYDLGFVENLRDALFNTM